MDSQPIKELFEKHNFVLLPFGSGVYSTHFGFRHSGICDTNLSATAARAIKKVSRLQSMIRYRGHASSALTVARVL